MIVLSNSDPMRTCGSAAVDLTQEWNTLEWVVLDEGFIFASKNTINNIALAHTSAPDSGVTLIMDGTYKITTDGWVLVVLGTHSVTVGDDITHTFRPFMVCWTKSENGPAVRAVMMSLKNVARCFLGIDNLHISAVSIDHS